MKNVQVLPTLPGIYIFKDAANNILYIGKAKNLRKRVSSYFNKQATDWKVHALIQEHATIEHIVTHGEVEALLLEVQMIQQYQPKYNALLKSGDPFLYLLFTSADPRELKIVRTKRERGTYFGPFIHKTDARRCYDYLVRTFKLFMCNAKISGGCLNYHLGRCAGNCTEGFTMQDYYNNLALAQLFLEGNYDKTILSLGALLEEYKKKFDFEKARTIASYIDNISVIFGTLKANYTEKKYHPEIAQATLPKFEAMDYSQGFTELQKLLGLPQQIHSLDCFDISHFQSQSIVGSCIRFTDGKPDKNKFRKFAIKTLEIQNDYAALHEVVSRRYKDGDFPDVILIDGGKGQLSAVRDLFPQIPFISLAKREERLYTDRHPDGLVLDLHTALGKLLIAIRDYAHHFAVTYHKLKRSKRSD